MGSWIEGRGGPPVFQDQSVNNIPTGEALPAEKMFAISIKFSIDHHSAASITLHIDPLGIYIVRLFSRPIAPLLSFGQLSGNDRGNHLLTFPLSVTLVSRIFSFGKDALSPTIYSCP